MTEPKNKEDYHFIPDVGWLPRVTQVLKIIAKGEQFEKWLREKGKEATTLLTDAGDIGSSLHNRLEEIGKGIKINKDALKERERRWVEEFEKWRDENIEKFIRTEGLVYNIKDGYAGTLDALVLLKDGRFAVLDYKTSKYIYDTHELQVCAYVKAQGVFIIDTAFILRFDKGTGNKIFEVKEIKDIDGQYEIFLCALKLWNWKHNKWLDATKEKYELSSLR